MTIPQISDLDQLKELVLSLQSDLSIRDKQITSLNTQLAALNEQIAWFQRQIFGKRSERVAPVNSQQLEFEGFDQLETQAPSAQEARTIGAHQRKKPNRKGEDAITFSPDIPVKTQFLDIPEEEKFCTETNTPLVQIGTETSHKLAHTPGSYYIKAIVRPKYAHPNKPESGILTAELPESILPKCRADNSLLAEIITRKFVDHMPLYRIAEGMGREGVRISRKLLSQWVVRCGLALKPLYNTMMKKILSGENIYIDESPVKLQEKKQCRMAYMWVIVGGNDANPAYRIYDFRINRRHENVLSILKDYRAVLHSDKYEAYVKLAQRKIVTWAPCWVHVRRKFFDAKTGDPSFRAWVLRKIRYLFMLEKIAWARSPEERLQIRQKKEAPIIDELTERIKNRLVDGRILPKSKFREALGYYCGLIPYLKNYIKHPFSRLDNNVAERAVRPLAIGRKNWLFFGSKDGGEAGAILLSFVQTCRGLGINPRQYLEDLFSRLMEHNAQNLEELLPDRWLQKNTGSTNN